MKMVGADGQKFLAEIDDPSAPQDLAGLAEIGILREVWEQWYIQDSNGELRARDPKEMPEGAHLIQTPYEVEARYSSKRSRGWVGYKVHLTESCDEGFPSLITGVHTTPATGTDVKQLSDIQEGLASSGVLPSEQLADAAYVSGDNLLASRAHHIDLIGPAYQDKGWQAKAGEGFDVSNFQVDWNEKVVRCPEGKESVIWSETKTARKRNMSRVISVVMHAGQVTFSDIATPTRARGHSGCQEASENRGVHRDLLPESGHRRDGFAGSQVLRASPGPLPGPKEDSSAAAGDCGGGQRQ